MPSTLDHRQAPFSLFLQNLIELVDAELAALLDLRSPRFIEKEAFTDFPAYVDRPQPLAAALAALMRSEVWDNVERKVRCLRAIRRAEVDDARRFVLFNIVETYARLKPEEARRFEAELGRETNKEVQEMVITWEDAIEARGFQQGEAWLLKRQLKRRHGDLPQWVEERLDQASREELESWADRVLDAKRLKDVFGSE